MKTPRKPKPPARSKKQTPAKAAAAASSEPEDNEDPLLLSDPFIAAPITRSRKAKVDAHLKINKTLDEELLRAAASEGDIDVDEDHILSTVGTLPNGRGFLAHGGGGGDPVFMGEGYVEGYEVTPPETTEQPKRKGRRKTKR
jgi:hypothetical protein